MHQEVSPDERILKTKKVLKEGVTVKDQIKGGISIGIAGAELGLGIAGLCLPEPTATKVIGGGLVVTDAASFVLSIDDYNELFTETETDEYEYGGGYIAWNMIY